MGRRIAQLAIFALGLAVSAWGQSASLGEGLCTSDSIAISPLADNLTEGWHTVTLNWNASSGALWYRVKRGAANGGPYSLIADCITATAYADVVPASQTFYYVVTAVNVADGDQESSNSNQATAAVPTYDTLVVGATVSASAQMNESLATSDALAPTAGFQLALGQSLSTSDAFTWVRASSLALAETLSTSDSFAAAAAFPVGLGETLSTNDALSISDRATFSVSESLITSDSLNASFAGAVSLAETFVTSDTISELATGRSANLTETLSTSDSLVPVTHFDPALAENLTTLDALVLTESFPGNVTFPVVPRPVLEGIVPGEAATSSCSLILTVSGRNFTPQSAVNWNNDGLSTTYVSPRQLSAVVPPSELQATAPAAVWVETPGGGNSMTQPFRIMPASPAVLLTQLEGSLLIVTGRNLVPTDELLWDGAALVTQYFSASELQAGLPFPVASTRGHSITVEDTRCGGP